MRFHSSCLFGIGQSLLVDFDLCASTRLVFFDNGQPLLVDFGLCGHSLLVDFNLCTPTRLVLFTLVSHCWWTLSCAKVYRQQTFGVNYRRYG